MSSRTWIVLMGAAMVIAGCSGPEFVGNPPNVACGAATVTEAQMRASFLAVEDEVGDVTRSFLSHVEPSAVAYDWTDGSSQADREAFGAALLETSTFVSIKDDFDDC